MIDLHAHLLPGIDDGPQDLASALELAEAACASGTHVMAATPHIGHQHQVVPAQIAGRLSAFRAAIKDAGIPLEVIGGGELAPGRALELGDEELNAIALGTSRCVLLECPFTSAGDLMGRLVAHLQLKGHRVLLAHPERSPTFIREPAALAELVRRGAYVQITAGSLRGGFGRTVQRACQVMLDEQLVHVVASDAHDTRARPPALGIVVRDELSRMGYPGSLVTFLCETAPRALLDDIEIPPQPPPAKARRLLWRARRRKA